MECCDVPAMLSTIVVGLSWMECTLLCLYLLDVNCNTDSDSVEPIGPFSKNDIWLSLILLLLNMSLNRSM